METASESSTLAESTTLPEQPPPASDAAPRVLTTIAFALTHSILGAIFWFATALGMMSTLADNAAVVLMGYLQIFLVPAAGVLGLILGICLGLSQRGSIWKRWFIGAAALLVLAVVVNGAIAILFA